MRWGGGGTKEGNKGEARAGCGQSDRLVSVQTIQSPAVLQFPTHVELASKACCGS